MSEVQERTPEDMMADKLFGSEESEADVQEDPTPDQAEDQEEASDAAPQSKAVEEEEVEFDGWKGKIPSKLRAELEKGADYTRKTQEIAEQRRALERQQNLDREYRAFAESASEEMRQLQQIDAQLAQFKQVDLSTIDQENLSRMSLMAANLREERAKLQESLGTKQGEFRQKAHATWDEMAAKARESMRKQAPDWDSVAPKLAEYAINAGYSFEAVTGHDRQTKERVGPGVVDPVFASTLLKAWRWDQLQTQKNSAGEKASRAAPVLKPGAVDPRSRDQIAKTTFKKAVKTAKSDHEKAGLIGDRLAAKFRF